MLETLVFFAVVVKTVMWLLSSLYTHCLHIYMKSHQEGLSGCNSCTEERKAESELETLCVVIFAYLIYSVLRNTL